PEIGPQRAREGEDVDDRELGLRHPPYPDEREDEEREAHPLVQNRPPHQPVLEEEDRGEDPERDDEHGDRRRLAPPDALPERLLLQLGRARARRGRGRRRPGLGDGRRRSWRDDRRGLLGPDVLVRQEVAEIERDERLVARADRTLDEELNAPRLGRIETALL